MPTIRFETQPSAYRHWQLDVQGDVATLAMNVAEDGGLVPGYALKLNSYDLGVDIELADAIQRAALLAPRRARARHHVAARPHVLRRREHLHARRRARTRSR